jgi:hypothetical protein
MTVSEDTSQNEIFKNGRILFRNIHERQSIPHSWSGDWFLGYLRMLFHLQRLCNVKILALYSAGNTKENHEKTWVKIASNPTEIRNAQLPNTISER